MDKINLPDGKYQILVKRIEGNKVYAEYRVDFNNYPKITLPVSNLESALNKDLTINGSAAGEFFELTISDNKRQVKYKHLPRDICTPEKRLAEVRELKEELGVN